MSEVRILAEGLRFPEAPVALPDGSVILVEIAGGTLRRIDPAGGSTVVARPGGGPNGLARGPDGALYLCNNGGNAYRPGHFMATGPADDYRGGMIQRVDPATGETRVLYTHCEGRALSAPNDLVFDASGGFYFTDLGKRHARHRDHGGLYYARPDGSRIVEVAYPILSPNGVGLSPDERTIYVADTESARLWAFPIEAPGVVRKEGFPSPHGGRLVAGLGGYQRFDSLKVLASGAIVVATLVSGCLTVINPAGAIVRQVTMPDSYPTNLCFGGPDLCTLYVTLSETGRLGMLEWPEPGLRLRFSA